MHLEDGVVVFEEDHVVEVVDLWVGCVGVGGEGLFYLLGEGVVDLDDVAGLCDDLVGGEVGDRLGGGGEEEWLGVEVAEG